jgi:outer membrane protein insertion porin family
MAMVAALAGPMAAVPLAPGLVQAQTFAFDQVIVEGNVRVDPATIIAYAGISRGEEVTAGRLNDAVQRIVESGLFENVDIETRGSTAVIVVQEYPIVDVINIEGNVRLDDEDLRPLLTSLERRVYSPSQALADAAAITEAYRTAGRLAATVEPRIIRRPDNRVDLVFEVTEGRVVEVERLAFNGNRAFSDRRLRQVLETKQAGLLRQLIQSDTFIAERLELDKQLLSDFYLSRGFLDFEVVEASANVARERDGVFVTFSIREGQKYSIGSASVVSEVEGLDAADFAAAMRLRPGTTYSPSVIENNIVRLENLALRKGLSFIRVEPRIERNDRGQTLDVTFAIVRGERVFVERIDIEGNTTTLDAVVRREFRTAEGDPFSEREIRQAAERIRALGFFEDAQVQAEPGSAPDQVVVNVDLVEKPTGSLSFGASYGLETGIGFSIGFSEQNFLGRGQGLSLSIDAGSSSADSALTFVEPAFLGRDLRFRFSIYYRETDNDGTDYDTRNIGITPSIEFPIGDLSRVELRYRLSEDRISNVPEESSPILRRDEDLGALVTSALGYSYTYDTRIAGLNPTTDYLFRFGQDFGGLGGETEYVATSLLGVVQTRVLSEEVTLRAIVEAGAFNTLGDDPSRVTDRFFGNSKIRGFERFGLGPRDLAAENEDALGGNMFAVTRFEADFPLGLPEEYGLTGGLFLDVGSVWSLDDTTGANGVEVDDSFRLRSAIGFSLFWTTPIGPLRFNFARALAKEDYDEELPFDLTVSTTF